MPSSYSARATSLYLYGTETPPANKADAALIRPTSATSPVDLEVDLVSYMKTGGESKGSD